MNGTSLFVAAICGSLLGAGAVRADLRFSQPIADAGEVRSGTPLAHRFEFVNDGTEPIEILETRTTCGCLTQRLISRRLAPGEAGSVQVEVHTLSQPAGSHTYRIHVKYRVGETIHEFELQLRTTIVTEVTVQPASLTIFADQAVAHELVVTDLRRTPLKVTSVHTSSARLKAETAEEQQNALGQRVRRIALRLEDDYPEGRHEEVIAIGTDDPTYRELRVPVTIVKNARQRLSVVPAQVELKAAPGQPVPSKIVLVRDSSSVQVLVTNAVCDHPAVACQWAQGPGAMSTVRLLVDRDKMTGPTLRTRVHIQVSQPVVQTLEVEVGCVLE